MPFLSQRDHQVLTLRLNDKRMADCHAALRAMQSAGTRGHFEQEQIGPPTVRGRPFYEAAS